jgi:hypothetical protein
MLKINPKLVSYFPPTKNDSFLSTFTTHSTTFSPQKNHVLHTNFPKTPLKNKGNHSISPSHHHASFFRAATLIFLASLTATPASPQFKKEKKQPKENIEWLWQYSPPPADGRENELLRDPRFIPFLAQYLTAPQTFWGSPKTGYKPLSDTALDYLSVPDKVIADDNRYLSISGCVFRFCPARGLLWVDLNGTHPLVVFNAIDWIKASKTPSEPGAEYTLWIFPNHPIDPDHIPAPLIHSVARWTAKPPAGSTVIQQITNTILVDPDGTPHQIPPASIGANTFTQPPTDQKAQP